MGWLSLQPPKPASGFLCNPERFPIRPKFWKETPSGLLSSMKIVLLSSLSYTKKVGRWGRWPFFFFFKCLKMNGYNSFPAPTTSCTILRHQTFFFFSGSVYNVQPLQWKKEWLLRGLGETRSVAQLQSHWLTICVQPRALRGREGLGRKRYGSTRVQLLAEAASCPVWRWGLCVSRSHRCDRCPT